MATECAQMTPASLAARQVQRLSMSSGPLMTRPARNEASPSLTTPFSRCGVQFDESTFPSASSNRALSTASRPAALLRKASVNSVKLIHATLPQTGSRWQKDFSLFPPRRKQFTKPRGTCQHLENADLSSLSPTEDPAGVVPRNCRWKRCRSKLHVAAERHLLMENAIPCGQKWPPHWSPTANPELPGRSARVPETTALSRERRDRPDRR
jgi:hypothetical protein